MMETNGCRYDTHCELTTSTGIDMKPYAGQENLYSLEMAQNVCLTNNKDYLKVLQEKRYLELVFQKFVSQFNKLLKLLSSDVANLQQQEAALAEEVAS